MAKLEGRYQYNLQKRGNWNEQRVISIDTHGKKMVHQGIFSFIRIIKNTLIQSPI